MASFTGTPSSSVSSSGASYGVALSVLNLLFFMMGFITCLNDILIPYLKLIFTLNYTQVMLINTCFFGAYFVMSIPAGTLVERMGYKKGMILGFVLAAIGAFLFLPAAAYKAYGLFLGALFILATGIVLLQVAGNPFVAALGSPETSSARLVFSQAFNSLGTTIAPFFGTYLILSNLPDLDQATGASVDPSAVEIPYLIIGGLLVLIALGVSFIKLPDLRAGKNDENSTHRLFDFPHLVLGVIGIFVYVGAEVAIGSFLINYIGQADVMGLSEQEAGHYVAYYWGGAMVGRFLGSALMRVVKAQHLLVLQSVGAALCVLLSIMSNGSLAMYSILAVGLFNSIMFATIFTLAIKEVGSYTDKASGILCTAIVGGALIPLIQGALADNFGLKLAFFLPLLCYLYIAFYGFKGYAWRK